MCAYLVLFGRNHSWPFQQCVSRAKKLKFSIKKKNIFFPATIWYPFFYSSWQPGGHRSFSSPVQSLKKKKKLAKENFTIWPQSADHHHDDAWTLRTKRRERKEIKFITKPLGQEERNIILIVQFSIRFARTLAHLIDPHTTTATI